MKTIDGVSLIIPVFNEEKTVENVIRKCAMQKCVKQLVVVNDGSTDKTRPILDKLEKNKILKKRILLTVIHHEKNKGKGAALRTAIPKALGKYLMVQDADLEYSPEDIEKLYLLAKQLPSGIVFGSRSHNRKKGYILAQLGNLYLNVMFNVLFGFHLTDAYTCYKMMPTKIWRKMNLVSNGFEIDSELIAKLSRLKCTIGEVVISYNPRKYKEGKKIKWTDLLKATKVALKIRFS